MVIKLRGFGASPKETPADRFLAAFKTVGKPSPFNPRQTVLDGAKVELSKDLNASNAIHITDIASFKSGGGKAALHFICDLADTHGVSLQLVAKGYAHTSTEALVIWYICSGFHLEYDFADFDEGVSLVRHPLASGFTLPEFKGERTPEMDRACFNGRLNALDHSGSIGDMAEAFHNVPPKQLFAISRNLYGFFAAYG